MRKLIFLLAAIAVLAALWLKLRPPAPSPIQAATLSLPTHEEAAKPEAARFVVKLSKAGVNGPGVFKVRQGDVVEFQITSDTTDEAHLHGYNLHAELHPGVPALMRFTADKSGRFELELHRSHQTIGALEVYPGQ